MSSRPIGFTRRLALGLLVAVLAGCTGVPLPPIPPGTTQPAPFASPSPATPIPSPQASPVPTLDADPTPAAAPSPQPTPATVEEWLAYGEAARLRSEFAGATNAFRKALELAPESGAAHAGLSRIYYAHFGRRAEALAEAEQAVKLAPDDGAAWTALANTQVLSLNPEALASAQKAVALAETAAAEAALSHAYRLDYHYHEALAAVERALRIDPDSAEAYIALAALLQGRGDLKRALTAAERAAELQPEYAAWQTYVGDIEIARGDATAGDAAYEKALRLARGYAFALAGIAFQKPSWNVTGDGLKMLTDLRDGMPDAIEPRLALANYTRFNYGGSEAAARFQEALRLDPRDQEARVGLAQSWLDAGECKKAADEYRALTGKHPRLAGAWAGLSSALLCLQDKAGALSAARRATEIDPYDGVAQLYLGDALFANGQYGDCLPPYLAALELLPTGQEHFVFGNDFYDSGDLVRAEQEYARAAELDPSWASPPYALCTVNLSQNKVKDAVTACRTAYGIDPTVAGLASQYAWALLLDNEAKHALDVLADAESTDSANVQANLAAAHYMLRQYDKAAEAFSRYGELNPGPEPDLASLVADLKAGYEVGSEDAQQLAQKVVPAAIGRPVTIGRETTQRGAFLTVEITGQPGETESGLVAAAIQALIAMEKVVPRIVGRENGAEVRAFTSEGAPVFAAYASKDALRLALTGLISLDQLLTRAEYEPFAAKNGMAASDGAAIRELGRKAAQVRDLREVSPVAFKPVTQEELTKGLDAQTGADLAAVRQDQAVLSLLGVIDRKVNLADALSDVKADVTLGYYDPQAKEFVYRTDRTPTVLQELTIAHEYVHALQDQHFTLGYLPTRQVDNDRRLAYRTLVEGDATLAQSRYLEEMLGAGDLLSATREQQRLTSDKADALPPAVLETLQFPYDEGYRFASQLYQQGGWKAVDAAFANPPRSTEQVLHLDKYLAQEEPQAVKAPELPATLAGSWRVVDSNVLGEHGWGQVVAARSGPMAGLAAGAGWGGDRYTLFQQSAGPAYMLAAATEWDDEAEAREFAELYVAGMQSLLTAEETTTDLLSEEPLRTWKQEGLVTALRRAGPRVFVVIGPDAESVSEVAASLD